MKSASTTMQEVINNPTDLSAKQIMDFTEAFRQGRYELVTSKAIPAYEPGLLLERQKSKTSYEKIFNDPGASLSYFSIKYRSSGDVSVILPIGVYGVSDYFHVKFPLYLDSFWQAFLWITKVEFGNLCQISGEPDQATCFSELVDLRKAFMQKVFTYYFKDSQGYYSSMVWKLRGKESNTRRVLEAIGYYRSEYGDYEVYSSARFTEDLQDYIGGCLTRKGEVIGGEQEGRADRYNPQFDGALFARSLVNLR